MPVYQFDELAEQVGGRIDPMSMVTRNFACLPRPRDWLTIKRLVDLTFCMTVFPIALVLLAIAWITLRLSANGPLLLRTLYLGHSGWLFWLISSVASGGLPRKSRPTSYEVCLPRTVSETDQTAARQPIVVNGAVSREPMALGSSRLGPSRSYSGRRLAKSFRSAR